MNETKLFTTQIKALVAKHDLKEALRQLRLLLENSPALEEALQQEERFRDIRRQIRLGLVDEEQANLLHNQISAAILELLRELDSPESLQPSVRAQVEQAAGVVNSKNVVVGSTIEAGQNAVIGDGNTIQQTFITYAGERKIPRLLSTPPFIPPVFIGRDDELREVHDRLFGGQNLLLLVNGQGGIGKTSFAAKYWELFQDKYSHLAFVYVGGGIAEALLSTVAPALALDFPDTMPTFQRFEQLIFFVANLQKPCLLVLDNANDAGDLEKIYPLLGRCTNFHLLLTSRLAEFEETASYEIGALKAQFPLDLFKKYYPRHLEAENELFWGIFRAVGGNTLVLEILAKNLREINQAETFYPLSQLLADLQGKGLLQLSEQAKVKVHWQGFEKTEPEQIIQALYDLHPLEADELALLSNLAVLPPENIPYPTLKSLLQPENARQFSDTLTRLFRKGWIEKGESDGVMDYKTSPVVQEIVRRKNPELRRDCRGLVDALNEKLDYEAGVGHFLNATYSEASHFVRYAEAVFANLPEPDWDLQVLTERIGRFHQTTGNLEQALSFYEALMQVDKLLCASDPDNADFKNGLAVSYERLGSIQSALGNLEQALTFFEQYNQLEKELYEA
ncbi:MAG: ATP-binding protein, partial [Saprospiraceae bacterium]|nr:ATP-binding protein [Saprospiraceae bacterium]